MRIMRMIALILATWGMVPAAYAVEPRCQAIQGFLTLLEAAEDMHLGGPMAALEKKPQDKDAFAQFASAYTGDYTKTIIGGLETLKKAHAGVAAIDTAIAEYATIRDKMLEFMKEELEGGTGAWEAVEAATSQHDPLGEAFVMWFVPERDRCEGNR